MDSKKVKKINIKVIIIAMLTLAVASVGVYYVYNKNKD